MFKKIRFFLIGKKGLEIMKTAIEINLNLIEIVVIGVDSNVKNDYSEEIIKLLGKYNIEYRTRIPNEILPIDVIGIAIGWRWIIQAENNLIVVHDSLLPKYRGFNPLVTALVNGDEKIGATAIIATEDYDKGEIICQKHTFISYPIKIVTAIDKMAIVYVELIIELFQLIEKQEIKSVAQHDIDATYSLWRDDEDYFVDWSKDSNYLERYINAVGFPFGGARTTCNGYNYLITDCMASKQEVKIENRQPGKVIFKDKDGFSVVCGSGILKVKSFEPIENSPEINHLFRLRLK